MNAQERLIAFNSLRALDDAKIIEMFQQATGESAVGKGKKYMIRAILDSGSVVVSTETNEDAAQEALNQWDIMNKAQMIMKAFYLLKQDSNSGGEYATSETLRCIYHKIFEDWDAEGEQPFYKPGWCRRINEIVEKSDKARKEGKTPLECAQMVIDGYKDLFEMVKADHLQAVLRSIVICANHIKTDNNIPMLEMNQVSDFVSAVYHWTNPGDSGLFRGKFKISEMEVKEVSQDEFDVTPEDECPDEIIQEPKPEPTPAPDTAEQPGVKFITETSEIQEFMKQAGRSLMFPTKYRQIRTSDIMAKSWAKFRKQHNLQGRWGIYIETEPVIVEQNENLKYKTPHCVGEDCVGCYKEDGMYYSNYPIGTIYIVRV